MSNGNSNDGFWGGILGGLVVSWTNLIMQKQQPEEDNWDIQDLFMDFTSAYLRKKEGYKLKYDIDESTIIPKHVNFVKKEDWLFEISIDNLRFNNDLEDTEPEIYTNLIDREISYTYEDNMYLGMIVFTKPKYWIYSVETDDYLTIITSNYKVEEYHDINSYDFPIKNVHDVFFCLNLNEVKELTNEMKRYYHNYYERVMLQESILEEINLDKTYKHWLYDIIPNYDKMIENISSIEGYPIDDVLNILMKNNYKNLNQIIYTLFSITNLLRDDYLLKAVIHLEYLLEINENILKKSKILNKILDNLIEIYIELRDEDNLIEIITKLYLDNSNKLLYLASEFDNSRTNLYFAAIFAYERLIDIENNSSNFFNLYLLYTKTNNIDGIRILREKLIPGNVEPWFIERVDKYLKINKIR